MLTCYQDVYQVMKERAFVSSGVSDDVHAALEKESFNLPPLLWDLLHGIVLFEEGSVHRVHHKALQALFIGEPWEALTQLISHESHSVVDALPTARPFDGVRQIAALWGKLFTACLNLMQA